MPWEMPMLMEMETTDLAAVDLAREGIYRFLAALLSNPRSDKWALAQSEDSQQLLCEAADILRAEADGFAVPLGFAEKSPATLDLRPVCAELQAPDAELVAEHARVFGMVPPRECPPNETEYSANSEPFFLAQQMADIAGFYRAFGLEPSQASPERPDHLSVELEFMAVLLMKKRLALTEPETE